jgi:hypothetical protein
MKKTLLLILLTGLTITGLQLFGLTNGLGHGYIPAHGIKPQTVGCRTPIWTNWEMRGDRALWVNLETVAMAVQTGQGWSIMPNQKDGLSSDGAGMAMEEV